MAPREGGLGAVCELPGGNAGVGAEGSVVGVAPGNTTAFSVPGCTARREWPPNAHSRSRTHQPFSSVKAAASFMILVGITVSAACWNAEKVFCRFSSARSQTSSRTAQSAQARARSWSSWQGSNIRPLSPFSLAAHLRPSPPDVEAVLLLRKLLAHDDYEALILEGLLILFDDSSSDTRASLQNVARRHLHQIVRPLTISSSCRFLCWTVATHIFIVDNQDAHNPAEKHEPLPRHPVSSDAHHTLRCKTACAY